MNILQQQIFILYSNLSEKVPNSEIYCKQISPDIENSQNLAKQIFSIRYPWYSLTAYATCTSSNLAVLKVAEADQTTMFSFYFSDVPIIKIPGNWK